MIRKFLRPYFYLFPAFFFLAIFTYFPIFRSFYVSLFRWNTEYPQKVFIGLQNYVDIYNDLLFWKVVKNTFFYSTSTIMVSMCLALLLALLVNQKIKFVSFYRASLFYPNIMPMVAVSLAWLWMYNPGYGVINHYLGKLGITPIEWLNDEKIALWSLVIVAIWKNAGYFMVFFLAGLQTVPYDLYDAARIEGANSFQKFWHVTFPLLAPFTFFVFIISIANSFQSIDQVYIMTQGAPNDSTNLFVYYIYQQAFRYWNMGYGATLTALLMIFLLSLTLIFFRFLGRRIYYQA